jgi:hypothetical protein
MVTADNQRDLIRVLNESGPPDQLYLKSHGKVQNEFRNKTWVYDFKGESELEYDSVWFNIRPLET